jgi:hypothetical protein
MRRLGTIAIIASALTLTIAGGAFAASSTATAPTGSAITVAAKSHVWTASTKAAAFHASATITITSTYSSGKVAVKVMGVKKGDVVRVSIVARPKTGKGVTIASHQITVTKTGSVSFSFALSSAQAHLIKTHVKAGDRLVFRVADGTKVISATFKGA